MKYDALIFDFGGVLTTPMQNAMADFAAEAGIELPDLARAALIAYAGGEDELVVGFETGKITEEEFARSFAQRLTEITGVEVPARGLIRRLFATLELEQDMLDAVEAARGAGLRTALLSNSWGMGFYPRDLLDPKFDVVVISAEVGMRKPDPAIFTLTTDRLGVTPARALFVDDHPGHLKAAMEAGMTTVLHRTPAETIAELEGLLGIPLGA